MQALRMIGALTTDAPHAPLVLCDFHRGQFGVTSDGSSLRLLDVDSLASYNLTDEPARRRAQSELSLPAHAVTAASTLFGDVHCENDAKCRDTLRKKRCLAVLWSGGAGAEASGQSEIVS